jgi:hypothetical protein
LSIWVAVLFPTIQFDDLSCCLFLHHLLFRAIFVVGVDYLRSSSSPFQSHLCSWCRLSSLSSSILSSLPSFGCSSTSMRFFRFYYCNLHHCSLHFLVCQCCLTRCPNFSTYASSHTMPFVLHNISSFRRSRDYHHFFFPNRFLIAVSLWIVRSKS